MSGKSGYRSAYPAVVIRAGLGTIPALEQAALSLLDRFEVPFEFDDGLAGVCGTAFVRKDFCPDRHRFVTIACCPASILEDEENMIGRELAARAGRKCGQIGRHELQCRRQGTAALSVNAVADCAVLSKED